MGRTREDAAREGEVPRNNFLLRYICVYAECGALFIGPTIFWKGRREKKNHDSSPYTLPLLGRKNRPNIRSLATSSFFLSPSSVHVGRCVEKSKCGKSTVHPRNHPRRCADTHIIYTHMHIICMRSHEKSRPFVGVWA